MADVTPSERLLKEVRGAFVTKGTSLTAVCRRNNVKRQNATKALVGDWTGPKANVLVRQLLSEAELLR